MAYAYGIDTNNSYIYKRKYSSIGHNIISSTRSLITVKGYKYNREKLLLKFIPKYCILRTSGLDYVEHSNKLP